MGYSGYGNNDKMKIGILVLIVFLILGAFIGVLKMIGIGGWGPERIVVAKVLSKHVDVSKNSEGTISSHYMVTTDRGTFEIDNGIMLGMFDADRIYGSLIEGKTYQLTTLGNQHVNFFMQYYPYIVDFVPHHDPPPAYSKQSGPELVESQ